MTSPADSARAYSLEEAQALADALPNPAALTRGGVLVHVNPAYEAALGYPASELVGRHFLDVIPPEERERLRTASERAARVGLSGGPFSALALSRDQQRMQFEVHTRELPGREGPPLVLASCFVNTRAISRLQLAELLVRISSALLEPTAERIRSAVVRGFATSSLRAGFFQLSGGALHAAEQSGLPGLAVEEATLREAVAHGRAQIAGPALQSLQVYLPLRDPSGASSAREVLVVEGELAPSDTPTLSLFAEQLASALARVQLISDLARRNRELEVVSEVARRAVEAAPSELSSLLAPMRTALDAEAVLLHLPEEGPAGLATGSVLVAQEGLDAARIAAVQRLPGLSPRATQEPRAVPSDASWTLSLAHALGASGSEVSAAPLVHGGVVLGALSAVRAASRPLDRAELRLLTTLADVCASTVAQRRLEQRARRRLEETRLLLDLARTTAGTLELSTILDVACDFLVRLLEASNCFILLVDSPAGVLRGAASSAGHREFFRGVQIPLGSDAVAARVARTRRAIQIEDATPMAETSELVSRFRETALLALPLITRDELVGVVVLDDTRGPRVFPPAVVELAEVTVGQLGLSIANARLYASLRESYQVLEQARAEVLKQERLAALGELSAVVAHEVRNPLGVIFNAVSSLRRMLPREGEGALLLDMLAEESDRLNRIVGELLDFARPRALSLQPEDVGKLVSDAVAVVRAEATVARTPEFTVSLDIAPNLPRVPVDRRLFRQALVNLMSNAVQAMPAGAELRIRLSSGTGRAAGPRTADGPPCLVVEISDDGPGIPEDIRARIFEPFFTTKAQGTGLGLAVVKRILEDHQGSVEGVSRPGGGTTFTLRVPM